MLWYHDKCYDANMRHRRTRRRNKNYDFRHLFDRQTTDIRKIDKDSIWQTIDFLCIINWLLSLNYTCGKFSLFHLIANKQIVNYESGTKLNASFFLLLKFSFLPWETLYRKTIRTTRNGGTLKLSQQCK